MHPKSLKLIEDVVRSCQYIVEDTQGETPDTYLNDRRLRQVVERNLEIIGEALVRLRTVDPETAALITDLHRIIGLRNRLAHGYDEESTIFSSGELSSSRSRPCGHKPTSCCPHSNREAGR